MIDRPDVGDRVRVDHPELTAPALMIDYRDGSPAVDVKDRHLWARDPRCARAYAELSEDVISRAYDDTVADFWQDIAPDIAEEYGYRADRNGHRIYSAGRSGGWLILACPPDLEDEPDTEDECAELEHWQTFAIEIRAAVQAAGEMFIQRLGEELAELEAAREACIIRSNN